MMVDFYNDNGQNILKEYLRNNPDEIKQLEKNASINEDWPPFESLSKEAFADKNNLMFPVFSKTAAQISALYAKAQIDTIPVEVKEKIQEACDLFGLEEDILGYTKIAAAPEELSKEDFIFPENKKLPVVDKNTWELSANVFLKIAEELSLEDAVIGARRLIKKANEFGIKPNKELDVLALKDKHISIESLKKEASNKFFETGDARYLEIEKIASNNINSNFDKLNFLVKLNRENNIDETKTVLFKVASENKDDIINIDNQSIPVEKLASIPEEEWEEVLPYSNIGALLNEDNSFSKEAFEKLYSGLYDIEKDALKSFIIQKIN